MESIIKASPFIKVQDKKHKIFSTMFGPLQHSLFQASRFGKHVGLWNCHCAPDRNATELSETVAKKMRLIKDRVRQIGDEKGEARDSTWTIPLPVNAALPNGSGTFGMVSYPNYKGPCRLLNYPDLNLFQDACRKAKVDCMFVYLYRHPAAILNSIVRRKFGGGNAESMQLYITHLRIISNQLRMHASKVLGCFGLFSEDPKEAFWLDSQRDLWSWENKTEHAKAMAKIYQKPHHGNLTNEERMRDWLKGSEHAPYLQSWWNVHEQTLKVCRQAVLENI